jgi:hypothetical protein
MNFFDAQIRFCGFVGLTTTDDSLRDCIGVLVVTWTSGPSCRM